MSKYIYRIMHLPIQRYLKWWLDKFAEAKEQIFIGISETNPAYLTDCLRKVFLKFIIKGKTEQFTTTGKNKLAYTLESLKLLNTNGVWNDNVYTLNNVNFIVNEDLSVLVNGTPSSVPTYLTLIDNVDLDNDVNYILNGCPDGGGIQRYSLRMYEGSSYVSDTGDGYSFTYSNQNIVRINIYGTYATENKLFKPMIRLSSIPNENYEPYTGGIPSPNPYYPQEIKNVEGTIAIVKSNADNTENKTYNLPLSQGQKLMEDGTIENNIKNDYGEYVFTGLENIALVNNCFQMQTLFPNIGDIDKGFCNIYKYNPTHSGITGALQNFEFGWNTLKLFSVKDSRFNTIEEYKAYLAEQYANGTPVKIQYKLVTPNEIPFTEVQQEVINEIIKDGTYKGITNISVTANINPDLYIEYYKSKEGE